MWHPRQDFIWRPTPSPIDTHLQNPIYMLNKLQINTKNLKYLTTIILPQKYSCWHLHPSFCFGNVKLFWTWNGPLWTNCLRTWSVREDGQSAGCRGTWRPSHKATALSAVSLAAVPQLLVVIHRNRKWATGTGSEPEALTVGHRRCQCLRANWKFRSSPWTNRQLWQLTSRP